MKTMSYTLSEKKSGHKKIKFANTNRDPYLNHPTLIDSNYDNSSGIKINEYMNDIHIANISYEFIQQFNKFIQHTNTQDLSNFFDIDIKNISINLTQLFTIDAVFAEKTDDDPYLIKMNEKYKNNYNFVSNQKDDVKKIIKSISDEQFSINKNYISGLKSLILKEDENNKKINNHFVILLNENIKNPIEFLQEETICTKDYKDDLIKYIHLSPIDINDSIISQTKEILEIKEKNIFSFEIQTNLNKEFNINIPSDNLDAVDFKENYNFKINSLQKNKLFDEYISEENIINDNEKPELSINISKISKLHFLDLSENTNNKNINDKNINNKNINDEKINFYKIINYNFDKLNFDQNMNDYKIINYNFDKLNFDQNIKENKKTISNQIQTQTIPSQTQTISSQINLISNINNLQYLNKNDFFSENLNYNYEPKMATLKINNKLGIISTNNKNDELLKEEKNKNNENILFAPIDKLNINIKKFIPEEEIENLNIYEETLNLEINIETDLKKFNIFLNNSFINQSDESIEYQYKINLNKLHLSCDCIINVYQLVYNENKIATGLGDFIRGSYFLIEFCKKYNFKYFIDLSNHPIKFFLKKYNKINLSEKIKNIYKKINKFEETNFNPIIDKNNFIINCPKKEIYFNFCKYLNNEKTYDRNIFIYSITFPNEGFINNFKEIMRNIFEPTNQMELLVNIKLKMLNLKPYTYEIIHLRCGDDFIFNSGNKKLENFNFILSEFDKLNPNKKYLLIADNNFVKNFIKEKYNFINILNHQIVHTGENREIIIKNLENTMLDFYLISKSKNVMSYSVYQHGSGFSKWCAFTYDIPYYCKYFGN